MCAGGSTLVVGPSGGECRSQVADSNGPQQWRVRREMALAELRKAFSGLGVCRRVPGLEKSGWGTGSYALGVC